MLLTKTQKKILEIVREYGGMKAEMLKRLCPEAYSFEVSLHQLEVNRRLIKTGEYYCDDTALICGRNTETAFEVMMAVCGSPHTAEVSRRFRLHSSRSVNKSSAVMIFALLSRAGKWW